MTTVISAEGLGKKYLISHQPKERYTALRDVLAARAKHLSRGILRPFSGAAKVDTETREEFWALRGVSFEIREGDRVGIIGRNGAGKSTLLKILSRITEPSTGRVKIRGRVASLLEVGTGFHPELTGRENIFLNGAILGMTRFEIKKKFDEIVAFAEVEKFLDTPVKRYSSGMYVRLAFAVAAHLEPEILLVDEVLAVGDVEFQKKCLGKMEDFGREGRTVVLVSHNMGSILSMCNYGILLGGGELLLASTAERAVNDYLKAGSHEGEGVFRRSASLSESNLLVGAELFDAKGRRSGVFSYGERMTIRLKTNANSKARFGVEVRLKNSRQQLIAYLSSWINKGSSDHTFVGGDTIAIEIPSLRLVQDVYYLDFICRIPHLHHVDNWWDSVNFTISNCRPGASPISVQAADQLGFVVFDDVVTRKASS